MTQFPTTRISLLLRVRNCADHAAWSEFVTIYTPVIYRVARRRGLQSADAQDLAQNVLAAVVQQIADWRPDPARAKFRTWLSQVARNQAVTMLRRRRPDAARGGSSMAARLEALPSEDDDASAVNLQYRRELFRYAARLVREEFAETTWQAFWLTTVEEVPIEEAARSLGRSTGSVYTARSRVMRRLRQVVQQLEFTEDRADAADGSLLGDS